MRIDAHQHFWKLDRGDYHWLTPDLSILYRDFLPQDLSKHLREHQMDKSIVVQAAPTVAETEYLLDLYKRYEFIAGVVGWLDLEKEDFRSEYNHFKLEKGFVGIRPMLQDLDDDRWILRPKVMKNIELLVRDDFPIDILIHPRHLPYIITLLKEFPSLRAVIDHIAKPDIANGVMEPWKEYIQEIAGFKNVMCKLSGMITEAKPPYVETITPFVHSIMQAFGPDSVMFGSDWPVCLLAGSYHEVYDILTHTLPEQLNSQPLQAIFGENAARFYKLT